MDRTRAAGDTGCAVLTWWARAAAIAVLVIAGLNSVGWAAGIDLLTQVLPFSPPMPPWTAALQAALAAAILVQSGRPSPTLVWSARVWIGCGIAVAAGVLAAVFLAEYATSRSFGPGQVLFYEAVQRLPDGWPGRHPSPTALLSVLLLGIAVAVLRLDRRWTRVVWFVCLPAALAGPMIALMAGLFGAVSLVDQSFPSILSVVLLAAAASLTRPDRNPVAWLLARPDRMTLIQMVAILAGLPILVGVWRLMFLAVGMSPGTERVLSLVVGVVLVGAAAFYFFQRQQRLLREREQRAEAEKRYSILADNAVDIIAHQRGGKIVWVSPSVKAAFGWPPEQWIGTDLGPGIHPDDLDAVAVALDEAGHGRSAVVRHRVRTAAGGYRWVETRVGPFIDSEGSTDGLLAAARIIDDQVEAEQQIKADKARFEAVVANTPSAISVRDLGHRYTLVNEAFCRLFGQASAGEVIGRNEAEVLSPGSLELSRRAAGGLLNGESSIEEESVTVGRDDTLVMTQRFPLRDSAGAITELVTIRTDVTQGKKAEREAAERTMWEERVWAAIGNGTLLVYAQPIVDIGTRETVAEELLVRLGSVESEAILAPAEFLPQCEKHGLIPVIDRYMVGCAIDLAQTGRKVSVNITGQTIGDGAAMSEMLQALTSAGPEAAEQINFEITETIALASPAIAKTFSRGMRDLGCRVALDDFGTGYGAFTELRNLDLDALKIDQSFVQNILENRGDERAVKTIVLIAREYGLTTVAEGVEGEAVLERLAELGVDHAQGYLFSKPQPVVW